MHETIPFSRIKLEDYEPAILEAMKIEDEEIAAIIANPEPPTFQNTIVPQTSELLGRATTIFFNLLNANTSDEMDELAQKLSPMLTEHSARIVHNKELFQRIKQVWENPGDLTDEERKLLADTYDGFVRSGALLNDEDKKTFAAI